jgi:hypothetical protein
LAITTNRSEGSFALEKTTATRDGIGLNSGALLVREWKGKLERVMVLDKGFVWNGKTFGSLSQVAKAITGVSWNGHRFFGLRSAKDQSSKRGVARPSAGEHGRREVDQSKDLGRADSEDNGREGSKGVGRGQTERPLAERKHPGARLTRRRVNAPEPGISCPRRRRAPPGQNESLSVKREGRKASPRCAIYTRVSTENGLEQEFKSLDNQREASEAYIRS